MSKKTWRVYFAVGNAVNTLPVTADAVFVNPEGRLRFYNRASDGAAAPYTVAEFAAGAWTLFNITEGTD